MYMAKIYGWTEVTAFSEDAEKAKMKALKAKKDRCKNDLDRWTWANVEEFYGATVTEIKEGLVIV